mgnify:CR=1 FL=1
MGVVVRLSQDVQAAPQEAPVGATPVSRRREWVAWITAAILGLTVIGVVIALRRTPLSVGELAERFPVSRPSISRHLRQLEDAGLVEFHAQGTRNVYAIRMQGFSSVREFLDSFWDVALARLEKLADK